MLKHSTSSKGEKKRLFSQDNNKNQTSSVVKHKFLSKNPNEDSEKDDQEQENIDFKKIKHLTSSKEVKEKRFYFPEKTGDEKKNTSIILKKQKKSNQNDLVPSFT